VLLKQSLYLCGDPIKLPKTFVNDFLFQKERNSRIYIYIIVPPKKDILCLKSVDEHNILTSPQIVEAGVVPVPIDTPKDISSRPH